MTQQVRWYSCFLGAEYSITSFISLLCDYWEISEMSPIFSYFAVFPTFVSDLAKRTDKSIIGFWVTDLTTVYSALDKTKIPFSIISRETESQSDTFHFVSVCTRHFQSINVYSVSKFILVSDIRQCLSNIMERWGVLTTSHLPGDDTSDIISIKL